MSITFFALPSSTTPFFKDLNSISRRFLFFLLVHALFVLTKHNSMLQFCPFFKKIFYNHCIFWKKKIINPTNSPIDKQSVFPHNPMGNSAALKYICGNINKYDFIKQIDLHGQGLEDDALQNILCMLEKNKSISSLILCLMTSFLFFSGVPFELISYFFFFQNSWLEFFVFFLIQSMIEIFVYWLFNLNRMFVTIQFFIFLLC